MIEPVDSPRFFEGNSDRPVHSPRQVRRLLPKPHRQWKKNHSAYELAHAWLKAGDIPVRVLNVLETCSAFAGARLLKAFFEQKTDLRTAGRWSQTELLAKLQTDDGLAIVSVHGKARETFGELVSTWLSKPGDWKKSRLEGLCADMELCLDTARDLRYELIQRTAATRYEAEQRGAQVALMLVHSFSPDDQSFDEFQSFTEAMSAPITKVNTISGPVPRLSRDLYFG